jgi:penicillin-binding protein 1C
VRRRPLATAGAAALAGIAGLALWLALPLPAGLLGSPTPGLVLLDRSGLPLRSTRAADGSLRRWVPLAEMDPDLLAAFVAVEDRRFFGHPGVDGRALLRAAWTDLRAGRVVAGGSTITMQLARLLVPLDRTVIGKLGQAVWAVRLERRLSKQAILEQYLNRVPLGQGAVGVEAAAALYFGAHATGLSLGQAALLAGLARAPSRDNPLAARSRAEARRAVALDRLIAAGYAAPATAGRARTEPVLTRGDARGFLAPHFTTLAAGWAERGVGGAAGGSAPPRAAPAGGVLPETTASAGQPVRTSLDLRLQLVLEAEVRHTVETLADRGASQAAAVVLDNLTGEVLAWVGSPDFWADTAGQVDMVVSPRQPGSALKPFLYALAFDRGYTPASILPDIARVYQTSTGPYHPRNYDRRFHGPVRAREALASSYNLPAVDLADGLGVGGFLHLLQRAGFGSLGRSAEYYGLGLALGNGDVTLLELANGYRALAAGGISRPWRWRAVDPGAPVEAGRRIASPVSAALVLDILADPVARLPGFGVDGPLDFPFPVAAKTGTSRHFTDNWAVGVTGGFTVAVWVGNFSGRPMDGVSGVSGAGPLLHRAVLATARWHPPGRLPEPAAAGAAPVAICRLSGLRATARCPTAVEWFAAGTAPERACDWHAATGTRLPPLFAEWAMTQVSSGAPGSPESFGSSEVPASATTAGSPVPTGRVPTASVPTASVPNASVATASVPTVALAPVPVATTPGPGGAGTTPAGSARAGAAAIEADASPRTTPPGPGATRASAAPSSDSKALAAADTFRILSPLDGDVYHPPVGVPARYATLALRAAGGQASRSVRWFVDGRLQRDPRWPLAPGAHRIRAVDGAGSVREVRVVVE